MNNNTDLTFKIVQRAEKLGIVQLSRLTLLIDLDQAIKQFNLNLSRLENATDFDFIHDICGIQDNINRKTKSFGDFIPRFADNKGEQL